MFHNVPSDLFLLAKMSQKLGSSSIQFFVCARPFDQKLVLINLFYLYRTIRLKIRVLIDLFLLFAHDHSTKLHGTISLFFPQCTTIRPKIRVHINLFFLFVHDHLT